MVQLLAFSLIPFFWWLITARKKENFFHWIGLRKPVVSNKKEFYLIFLFLTVLFIAMAYMLPFLVDTGDVPASGVTGIIMYSFVQTGLSEEILFRGFLAKRLMAKFGFMVGNISQAVIFGGLHGLIIFSAAGLAETMFIMIFTGCTGFVLGWLNEKKAGGSIIPGWLLHSVSNLSMALFLMF